MPGPVPDESERPHVRLSDLLDSPEHAGRRRVLTSGCRHATSEAQAAAGAQALIAARILLDDDTVSDSQPLLLDHGGAGGADTAVWKAAGDATPGWETVCHPAQWGTHIFTMPNFAADDPEQRVSLCPPRHVGTDVCVMAGHRRNAAMIALAPKLLLAMPTVSRNQAPQLGRSKGTWDCVDSAVRAGSPPSSCGARMAAREHRSGSSGPTTQQRGWSPPTGRCAFFTHARAPVQQPTLGWLHAPSASRTPPSKSRSDLLRPLARTRPALDVLRAWLRMRTYLTPKGPP